MGPRLIRVYLIEIMGVSRVHSKIRSALTSDPPGGVYPINKAEEIVDLMGSLLGADRGSRCRAETQSGRDFVPRFLQTVPRGSALALHSCFTSIRLHRGLSPPDCWTCPAHRRAFARGPAALLDLRSARRPWGIRSGRRNDQSPIEQRNWETLEAQAGMAIAGSNGWPVFRYPEADH